MNDNVEAVTLLSRSPEWWDRGMLWCLAFVAIAAVAVGIFTWGSVTANKRAAKASELALGRFQNETVRLGKVHSAAIEASKSETAQANALAAKANERAAEAELAFETERVARLQLEASLRARTLRPDQASRFQAALARFGLRGIILTRLGDAEAGEYADQIARVLAAAGLLAGQHGVGMMVPPPYGIIISGQQAVELASAFRAAGLPVASAVATVNQTTVLVGLKPPPQI